MGKMDPVVKNLGLLEVTLRSDRGRHQPCRPPGAASAACRSVGVLALESRPAGRPATGSDETRPVSLALRLNRLLIAKRHITVMNFSCRWLCFYALKCTGPEIGIVISGLNIKWSLLMKGQYKIYKDIPRKSLL